jgi:hypothetical protein
MRSIHTEIGIDRPVETVWAALADFGRWAEWNPFAQPSGRLALGERLEVRISPPGRKPMTFRPTVVALDPGRELRWLGRLGLPGLFDGEHGFRVSPDGAGRSRFEHFEAFGGILVGPILWFAGDATRAGFEAMNRALKSRVESQ